MLLVLLALLPLVLAQLNCTNASPNATFFGSCGNSLSIATTRESWPNGGLSMVWNPVGNYYVAAMVVKETAGPDSDVVLQVFSQSGVAIGAPHTFPSSPYDDREPQIIIHSRTQDYWVTWSSYYGPSPFQSQVVLYVLDQTFTIKYSDVISCYYNSTTAQGECPSGLPLGPPPFPNPARCAKPSVGQGVFTPTGNGETMLVVFEIQYPDLPGYTDSDIGIASYDADVPVGAQRLFDPFGFAYVDTPAGNPIGQTEPYVSAVFGYFLVTFRALHVNTDYHQLGLLILDDYGLNLLYLNTISTTYGGVPVDIGAPRSSLGSTNSGIIVYEGNLDRRAPNQTALYYMPILALGSLGSTAPLTSLDSAAWAPRVTARATESVITYYRSCTSKADPMPELWSIQMPSSGPTATSSFVNHGARTESAVFPIWEDLATYWVATMDPSTPLATINLNATCADCSDAVATVSCCSSLPSAVVCGLNNAACGSATLTDNCNITATLDCGNCTYGSCVNNTCFCVSDSDAAFCASRNSECGYLNDNDNCGVYRSVYCGDCLGVGRACADSGVNPAGLTPTAIGINGANSFCYTVPNCSIPGAFFGLCGASQTATLAGQDLPYQPSITWNSVDLEYFVVAETYDTGASTWNLVASRFSYDGVLKGSVVLAPLPYDQRRPSVAYRPFNNVFLIVYEVYPSGPTGEVDVGVLLVDNVGTTIESTSFTTSVATNRTSQLFPQAAFVGNSPFSPSDDFWVVSFTDVLGSRAQVLVNVVPAYTSLSVNDLAVPQYYVPVNGPQPAAKRTSLGFSSVGSVILLTYIDVNGNLAIAFFSNGGTLQLLIAGLPTLNVPLETSPDYLWTLMSDNDGTFLVTYQSVSNGFTNVRARTFSYLRTTATAISVTPLFTSVVNSYLLATSIGRTPSGPQLNSYLPYAAWAPRSLGGRGVYAIVWSEAASPSSSSVVYVGVLPGSRALAWGDVAVVASSPSPAVPVVDWAASLDSFLVSSLTLGGSTLQYNLQQVCLGCETCINTLTNDQICAARRVCGNVSAPDGCGRPAPVTCKPQRTLSEMCSNQSIFAATCDGPKVFYDDYCSLNMNFSCGCCAGTQSLCALPLYFTTYCQAAGFVTACGLPGQPLYCGVPTVTDLSVCLSPTACTAPLKKDSCNKTVVVNCSCNYPGGQPLIPAVSPQPLPQPLPLPLPVPLPLPAPATSVPPATSSSGTMPASTEGSASKPWWIVFIILALIIIIIIIVVIVCRRRKQAPPPIYMPEDPSNESVSEEPPLTETASNNQTTSEEEIDARNRALDKKKSVVLPESELEESSSGSMIRTRSDSD